MLKFLIRLLLVWMCTGLTSFSSAFSMAEEAKAPEKYTEKIVFGGSKTGVKINVQQGSEATFNIAFDKLMAHRGIDLNLHIFESSQALFDAFNRDEINAVFASPLEFMQLQEHMGETLIAVNYQNAPIKQSFVVLARKSDHITDIKQLKHKRLSLAPLQDVAQLYLNTLLLARQEPEIPAFFTETFESKNANVAVMDVFFGKSDVAVVRESELKQAISLNPQVEQQLAVLEKSPAFLNMVGAGKKTIDEKKFREVMFSITGVSKTEDGKKLFKVINAEELHLISRADLTEVTELLNRYKTLSKNKEKTYVE